MVGLNSFCEMIEFGSGIEALAMSFSLNSQVEKARLNGRVKACLISQDSTQTTTMDTTKLVLRNKVKQGRNQYFFLLN